MNAFNIKADEEESKFDLSIVNAILSRQVRNYLLAHPRVLNVVGDDGDIDDPDALERMYERICG